MPQIKSQFAKPVYLGASVRTPIGKFGGSLKHITAPKLASLTLAQCIVRSQNNKSADFVFLGHARQAGAGPNPARQATLFSGLSENVPALTINQACASGMTAVTMAAEKIASGRAQSIFAGGVESMSNTPYLLMDARFGKRLGHGQILDGMYQDGFNCPMAQMPMGETVERFLAQELKISRAEQDAYALSSQQRAAKSWNSGLFKNEVFEIAPEGKNSGLSNDEHRRDDTSLESLAKLPPVFDPKGGSVTAGNSSGITDGAAFVQVSNSQNSWTEAEILDFEFTALDPKRMGLGPVAATQQLLKRNNLAVSDIEAFEINEAFAAQVLACNRELKIPIDKLNVRGGSIAIGHPIGATGCRILVTLIHQLLGKPGALGIATLCVSGGMGAAVLIRSTK